MTFLIGILCFFSNPANSQNTKGDRPLLSPGSIRENPGRQNNNRNNRTINRSGRSVNPRKSGILKNLTDRKSSGGPSSERASVSPRRISPPRTASKTGRVAEQVIKPYVNNSSYSPPASQQADRSGRTASGRRLVTRQPSRSVNIYEWSGPKPRQAAPERAREERAYSGNRTASGKKIVDREPSGRSRNLYLGSQKFVTNPSPRPRPSENFSSSFRTQRGITSNQRGTSDQSGSNARSASRSFVTPAKNNVYWGKFSPQQGKISTDMYGRPLRRKDFETSAKEILPSDTVPGINRQTISSESSTKRKKSNRTATKSGVAWQGDITGKKLRTSSADPRRDGPAQLLKEPINIRPMSGKNNGRISDKPGLSAGAGALMKAGAKGYLKNSAGVGLRAGQKLSQINKIGKNRLIKGNIRTSARYSGGLKKQGSGINRSDFSKQGGIFSAGIMKPAYGGRSSGGKLELFGKNGEGLLKKNYATSKADPGATSLTAGVRSGFQAGGLKRSEIGVIRIYGKNDSMDSGLSIRVRNAGKERYQKFASARATGMVSGNLRRTTNGVALSNSRSGRYAGIAGSRSQKSRSRLLSRAGVISKSGFTGGGLKRNTIGIVNVYGKGNRNFSEQGLFKAEDVIKNKLNRSHSVQRSGFKSGSSVRSVFGTVRMPGRNGSDLTSSGMYRIPGSAKVRYHNFPIAPISGFQTPKMERSAIGTIRLPGKDNAVSGQGIYRSKKMDRSALLGGGSDQRPGFQLATNQRSTIGAFFLAGKRSYPAEYRRTSRNAFQLQAGDFRRLNNYPKEAKSYDGLNKIGLNIKSSSSEGTKTFQMNLKENGYHVKDKRLKYEVRNYADNLKPVNVGGIGKQQMVRRQSPTASAGGYVVKVASPMGQKSAVLTYFPYLKPKVVGANFTKITERFNYRITGSVSSRDWYRQPLKFQFSDYKVNRKIATNVNPDKRFTHQKESQTEEVITFKTRILMLFTKSAERNDPNSSDSKQKQRKPGYDPREAKIWYD